MSADEPPSRDGPAGGDAWGGAPPRATAEPVVLPREAGPTAYVIPPGGLPPVPDRASASPARSRVPAMLALVFGALAAVSCLLLLIPAWGSTAGPWVTMALAIAGIASGIVALEGGGRRAASATAGVVVALVAGVFGAASAIPQPDLAVHVYGYADCQLLSGTPPDDMDPDSYYSAFFAPDLVGVDTIAEPSFAYGTTITVAPTGAMEPRDIATFRVNAPVDVTDRAGSPPQNGVYVAVPVTIEATPDGGLECFQWRAPPSYWFVYDGDYTAYTTVSIPGYPTIEDGGRDNGDGTLTYYDIFDVSQEDVSNGGFELDMLEPDGTIRPVFWAEEP
ncbi:hypothetical protein [Microbacterium sp. NPDC056569]|uniref:hypothetical protein n=1 Tax=Microbacterium sp. NPDC056569 TaxID=3345867 RepID=UPI0036726D39